MRRFSSACFPISEWFDEGDTERLQVNCESLLALTVGLPQNKLCLLTIFPCNYTSKANCFQTSTMKNQNMP